MSIQFRGKPGVYCFTNPPTSTGDHVFAREFFPESERADLPKVPACERCNNGKSMLEHYLNAVLPFDGRHVDALANLQELVPGQLAKNAKLHRELAHARGLTLTEARPGLRLPTMTLPIDSDRLHQLFGFATKKPFNSVSRARYQPDAGLGKRAIALSLRSKRISATVISQTVFGFSNGIKTVLANRGALRAGFARTRSYMKSD